VAKVANEKHKISGKRSGPPPLRGPNPQGIDPTQKAFIDKSYTEKEVLTLHDFKTNRQLSKEKDIQIYRTPEIMLKNKSKKTVRTQNLNKGGCPYRDSSLKNTYPGNNGIQIKGFKFTGVK